MAANTPEWRRYLPDLSHPRFTTAKEQDPYEYVEFFRNSQMPPWLYELTQAWQRLYAEPFSGVTNDGNIKMGLYHSEDKGVQIENAVDATNQLLAKLSPDQKQKLMYPINAREWRAWSNPELLLRPFGLRLEELPDSQALHILAILEQSFSSEGYAKALGAMRTNHFLGQLCEMPRIMNKYSYNFLLFGEPSTSGPWGWLLYGHHLCLNAFFLGSQIVVSPTFTGCEPNEIDTGDYQGTKMLQRESELGLQLMQSLPPELQSHAQTYKLLQDPAKLNTGDLIHDRWNQDDQRHLCGAFRDNRVVPYEGLCVANFDAQQQKLAIEILDEFLIYFPLEARKAKLAQIQHHFSETFFSWIGGFGNADAFYYRIQSPVIIVELDHHSGVYLTNKEPAKFHMHTIVRFPNGGDYGNALRAEKDQL